MIVISVPAKCSWFFMSRWANWLYILISENCYWCSKCSVSIFEHWIKAWNTIFHFCTKIILVFRVFILIFTTSNHPYTWLAWPWVSSIIYLVVSRNLWARASSLTTSRIFFPHIFFSSISRTFIFYICIWMREVPNEYRKYEVESKV